MEALISYYTKTGKAPSRHGEVGSPVLTTLDHSTTNAYRVRLCSLAVSVLE